MTTHPCTGTAKPVDACAGCLARFNATAFAPAPDSACPNCRHICRVGIDGHCRQGIAGMTAQEARDERDARIAMSRRRKGPRGSHPAGSGEYEVADAGADEIDFTFRLRRSIQLAKETP